MRVVRRALPYILTAAVAGLLAYAAGRADAPALVQQASAPAYQQAGVPVIPYRLAAAWWRQLSPGPV